MSRRQASIIKSRIIFAVVSALFLAPTIVYAVPPVPTPTPAPPSPLRRPPAKPLIARDGTVTRDTGSFFSTRFQ